ncbi:hypothetical protein V8C26DRAFT_328984 [Trichoderma gracile]
MPVHTHVPVGSPVHILLLLSSHSLYSSILPSSAKLFYNMLRVRHRLHQASNRLHLNERHTNTIAPLLLILNHTQTSHQHVREINTRKGGTWFRKKKEKNHQGAVTCHDSCCPTTASCPGARGPYTFLPVHSIPMKEATKNRRHGTPHAHFLSVCVLSC